MSRPARVERSTSETKVTVELELDGDGTISVETGVPFFDHMLAQLGRHAGFDLSVRASGDTPIDDHHTVEDVGLALGDALKSALGDKAGIARHGDALVCMDETLVLCALDLSGRPYLSHKVSVPALRIGTYDPALTDEFLRALVNRAGMTLHLRLLEGRNAHHIVEGLFKALAKALGRAVALTGRAGAPSTKGVLE